MFPTQKKNEANESDDRKHTNTNNDNENRSLLNNLPLYECCHLDNDLCPTFHSLRPPYENDTLHNNATQYIYTYPEMLATRHHICKDFTLKLVGDRKYADT